MPRRSIPHIVAILLLAFACSDVALAAETAGRDAAIARIMKLQLRDSLADASLAAAGQSLAFIRQSNPTLDDNAWHAITGEVSKTMSQGMSSPGNPMFATFRKALAPLSDGELAELEAMLATPAYRKYASAIVAPATQQDMMRAMIENGPGMITTMNFILRKHGFKEVH